MQTKKVMSNADEERIPQIELTFRNLTLSSFTSTLGWKSSETHEGEEFPRR